MRRDEFPIVDKLVKDSINEVLDKIRDEIEHLTYYWCEVNPRTVIDDVLQIIDKYTAEEEEFSYEDLINSLE